MGGIAGILSFTRGRADPRRVEGMLERLHKRGPDDSGLRRSANGRLALGGCRSLPSESEARTPWPLANETGEVLAVIDGEIDNHRALRHSLELDGHRFDGEAAGEVLVHAYEQYGLGFLDHLHGRFALALWDEGRHRLLLARDRLGEKPLYWTRHEGMLAFSSEARCLLDGLSLPRRLNTDMLPQFLAHGFVLPPDTLIEGIRKLGAGEALLIERGSRMQPMTWWTPARDARRAAAVKALSADHHRDNLRVLLDSAVADRLTAPTPIAAQIDDQPESLAVAVSMSRLLGRPVEAFALPADAARHRAAAARTAVSLQTVEVSAEQMMAGFGDYLRAMDEPLADPQAVADWWLARAMAKSGLTLGMAASGADTAFLGRDLLARHQRAPRPWRLLRRLPPALRPAAARLALAGLRLAGRGGEALALRHALDGEPALFTPGTLFADPAALLSPEGRALLRHRPPADAVAQRRRGHPAWLAGDELGAMAFLEMQTSQAEGRLRAIDRMTMAHSVEMRLPFVDDALVDYALAVPGGERAAGGHPKELLLCALRGLLPAGDIPDRRDGPQAAPADGSLLAGWFRSDLGDRLEHALDHHRLFAAGGPLDRQAALHLLRDHQMGRVGHHRQLWALLVLSEWVELLDLAIPGALSDTAEPPRAAVG